MPFDLLFTGDFYVGTHANGRLMPAVHEGNTELIFGELLPVLTASKLTIINLEAPLTDQLSPQEKTGPSLHMPSKVAPLLAESGISIACLANNHVMDHGSVGLTSTIALLEENQLDYVGAHTSATLKSTPLIKEINGRRLGFINVCENEWIDDFTTDGGANGLDEMAMFYQIEALKSKSDFIFVVFHGGNEYHALPSPRIKKTLRYFIDLGADAVIGHHTHTFSGMELYNNKPIFYSLGNFIFDSQKKSKGKNWHHGFLVGFNLVDNQLVYQMLPFKQHGKILGVEILKEKELVDFTNEFNRLSTIIQDTALLNESYVDFALKHTKQYQSFINPYEGKLNSLFKRGYLPSLFTRNKNKLFLNLIRCESHRDVLRIILGKSI